MNYKEAREYIEETSQYGSILGLENMKNLLDGLDHPEKKLKFIHIAGTNGKGSTLAFISTILKKSGYTVGRYISPTIFKYRERIQVDGRYIEKESFAHHIEKIQLVVKQMLEEEKSHPTAFEIETALAFLYFLEKNCDIVVIETGLGGTLDATNVIENTICAVITKISRDHMGILGNSLKEIAMQKAGIIKKNAVVISAKQQPEVAQILLQASKEKKCACYFIEPSEFTEIVYGYDEQKFRYKNKHYQIHLAGNYQIENAALALRTVEFLKEAGWKIPENAIAEGLKETKWVGRFTKIHSKPLFIVDGAHNEDAARTLRESIELYFKDRRIIFIMGVFADKEYEKIVELTVPLASEIITIATPGNTRALPALELAKTISEYQKRVTAADSLQEAVEMSFLLAGKEDVIIAFGSLSYLGDLIGIVEQREQMRSDLHGKQRKD